MHAQRDAVKQDDMGVALAKAMPPKRRDDPTWPLEVRMEASKYLVAAGESVPAARGRPEEKRSKSSKMPERFARPSRPKAEASSRASSRSEQIVAPTGRRPRSPSPSFVDNFHPDAHLPPRVSVQQVLAARRPAEQPLESSEESTYETDTQKAIRACGTRQPAGRG